jgi:hypothetical protein
MIDEGLQKVWSRQKQAKFARTFGRSSTGTALFATGFGLAALGYLTGSMSPEDDDRGETSEFFKRMKSGVENKSLLIPGVGRFVLGDDPASKTIAAGATLYDQTQMTKGDSALKVFNAAREATFDTITEQPLMEATGSLLKSVKKGKLGEGVGGVIGGYVPTLVSDVGEVLDEKPRTSSGYKKGEPATAAAAYGRQRRGFNNSVLRRVPGIRTYVDESTYAPGPEIRGGMLRRAVRAIDPFNSRPALQYKPPKAKK